LGHRREVSGLGGLQPRCGANDRGIMDGHGGRLAPPTAQREHREPRAPRCSVSRGRIDRWTTDPQITRTFSARGPLGPSPTS
jgi:hypothetical protein